MKTKFATQLGDLLSGRPLAHLQTKITQLRAINQCFQSILPEELTSFCEVANFEQKTLVIVCSKSSVSTKLNFMLPDLLQSIRGRYPGIEKAKVILRAEKSTAGKNYWAKNSPDESVIDELKKIVK